MENLFIINFIFHCETRKSWILERIAPKGFSSPDQNHNVVIRVNPEHEVLFHMLFEAAKHPSTNQQKPMNQRVFPRSFFTPPQSGSRWAGFKAQLWGIYCNICSFRTPAFHSRESSLDSSNFSLQPCSPDGHLQMASPLGVEHARNMHVRTQSLPVQLQVRYSAKAYMFVYLWSNSKIISHPQAQQRITISKDPI